MRQETYQLICHTLRQFLFQIENVLLLQNTRWAIFEFNLWWKRVCANIVIGPGSTCSSSQPFQLEPLLLTYATSSFWQGLSDSQRLVWRSSVDRVSKFQTKQHVESRKKNCIPGIRAAYGYGWTCRRIPCHLSIVHGQPHLHRVDHLDCNCGSVKSCQSSQWSKMLAHMDRSHSVCIRAVNRQNFQWRYYSTFLSR